VRRWVWARPLSAPARQRSGWHAACAAQIICIRTRTCGSPARCSSFATSRALDEIKPSARRWAWAPPRKCAATNSCRLACVLCSYVNKAQTSPLHEFEAARQPHGRPSALVPPGAAHRRVGAPALRRTCRLCSCVSKAQNSHLPEFGAAQQPHGRPGALVPPGASATERGRCPACARPQTRAGWHAPRAAVLPRPRTLTCPSLERRGSRTAGRERLCRLAPARPARGRRPESARPKLAAAGMRAAQLCQQGPEQSPARV